MSTPTGEERETAKLAPTDRPRGRIPADTFANRLMLARKLDGLTIREAAAKAGLNYGSWSNWENGKRCADILDVAAAIADALDIDEQWLLFGGQLESSRGRPTKRAGDATGWYQKMAIRTAPARPKGRTDRERPMSPSAQGGRPTRVNADQLAEAVRRNVMQR